MKREDDGKLWDLLGQARTPDVSPFFARNVLRTARNQPSYWRTLSNWFRLSRLVPATTVAVALIVSVFIAHVPAGPGLTVNSDSDPAAKIDPQDYEVVADLDELIASDENALWDDNSSL